MKWISVIKKKPKNNQIVLSYLEDGTISVLKFIKSDQWGWWVPEIPYDPAWTKFNNLSRVSYWMPLPELPRKE